MWWRTIWCMWAFVAIGPSPAHAQCVVALEHARRVVTVDRGDGIAIDIAMRGARAQVTVPLVDAPLEVRVDDTLAFAGTGSASLLSLAAGTYGGALEVPEGGVIRIARARLVLRTDPASDDAPLHIRGLRPWDPIAVVEERDRWRCIPPRKCLSRALALMVRA